MAQATNPTTKVIDAALVAIRETQAAKLIEREAVATNLRAIDAELKQLGIAERALDVNAPTKPVRVTSVETVRAVMTEKGTATMSQVAEAIGRPKNTAKHGLTRLEKEGVIRRTGKMVDRSPEFEMVEVAAA